MTVETATDDAAIDVVTVAEDEWTTTESEEVADAREAAAETDTPVVVVMRDTIVPAVTAMKVAMAVVVVIDESAALTAANVVLSSVRIVASVVVVTVAPIEKTAVVWNVAWNVVTAAVTFILTTKEPMESTATATGQPNAVPSVAANRAHIQRTVHRAHGLPRTAAASPHQDRGPVHLASDQTSATAFRQDVVASRQKSATRACTAVAEVQVPPRHIESNRTKLDDRYHHHHQQLMPDLST